MNAIIKPGNQEGLHTGSFERFFEPPCLDPNGLLDENFTVTIRNILLASYEDDSFLETVLACSKDDHADGERELVAELVAIHNEGLIDVVDAFGSLKAATTNQLDFFSARHVFEKALPDLEAPVPGVVRCVLHLYREAGRDLAAGTILNSFIEFCAKDPSRPKETLEVVEESPDELKDLLPATLIAGSRVDESLFYCETVRLCKDENIELRRRAFFSLGQLNLTELSSGDMDPLSVLEAGVNEESDDQLLSNVIKSAFSFLHREPSAEPRVREITTYALSKGDEQTLHAATEIFSFKTSEHPRSVLEAFLDHLPRIKPTNKGTISYLDLGISNLLKNGESEIAIQLLEGFLLAHADEESMACLESTGRQISKDKTLFAGLLTSWFRGGDHALCEAVASIFRWHGDSDPELEINPVLLEPSDPARTLFVAYKTIGYLFMQPISAASVLLSIMRNTNDDEVLSELGKLLFDPLLLNYPGKVRDFVLERSELESGKVQSTVKQALRRIDEYLDDLRSIGNLAALHPSEAHRETFVSANLSASSWVGPECEMVLSEVNNGPSRTEPPERECRLGVRTCGI